MRLTVIGCSGTYAGPASACSAYLLEADGFRLVIDLGNGAIGRLQEHVDVRDVDTVLVSHLHADHCIDLVSLYYARHYHPQGTSRRLSVLGPEGTRERILEGLWQQPLGGIDLAYDIEVVGPGHRTIGPFEVELVEMVHPVQSLGMRISHGGRVLAYSSDTAPTPALSELARDADLFLCEASWLHSPDNPPGVHLSGREAGEAAAAAGARRLVLTHVVPYVDPRDSLAEARSAYDGVVELATPGLSVEV